MDISSEYGHFRKFNTTSSPLTYSIPTLPAITGLLGAILGIEREIATGIFPKGVIPLHEVFHRDTTKFAIQVLHPTKKVNIAFNLLDTGKSGSSFFNIENRTQIEFELLKNPKFRLYISMEDETLLQELSEKVKNVEHHFTPYLGLSQFTAIIEWQSLEVATEEKSQKDYQEIHSALNLSQLNEAQPIKFDTGFYSTDTMPMAMRKDRVVTEYAEILLEREGKSILTKTNQYWKTNFGNILFL